MGEISLRDVWCGGVTRAPLYGSDGRYRPDIAGWVTASGRFLAARAVPPGGGANALGTVLHDALARARLMGAEPRELHLENATQMAALLAPFALPMALPRCLPIHQQPHWHVGSVIDENLHRVTGLGMYLQGYVERGVDRALAAALFAASNEALGLLPMELQQPQLAAVLAPAVAPDPVVVWVGHEPTHLGMGLRFFRHLEAYRDYMQAQVRLDWEWDATDDRSLLGLRPALWQELNAKQRRDLQRYRFPMYPPGLAPDIVVHDAEGVPRPYGPGEVWDVVLLTRALCEAYRDSSLARPGPGRTNAPASCKYPTSPLALASAASAQAHVRHGAADGIRVEFELLGEHHQVMVWLQHPDASSGDVRMVCSYEQATEVL